MAENGENDNSSDRRTFLKAALVTSTVTFLPLPVVGLGGCTTLRHAAQPSDKAFDSFMELSRQLTGVGSLPQPLGREYFQRCIDDPDLATSLTDLLLAFDRIRAEGGDMVNAIREKVMAPASPLRAVAQQIIYLWYLSAMFSQHPADPNIWTWKFGSSDQYDQALAWAVILAHPPMTRGGPFGHWAYPPR